MITQVKTIFGDPNNLNPTKDIYSPANLTTQPPNSSTTFSAFRSAHNYFLEKGVVDSRPDHILNLIHYEVRVPFHL